MLLLEDNQLQGSITAPHHYFSYNSISYHVLFLTYLNDLFYGCYSLAAIYTLEACPFCFIWTVLTVAW